LQNVSTAALRGQTPEARDFVVALQVSKTSSRHSSNSGAPTRINLETVPLSEARM